MSGGGSEVLSRTPLSDFSVNYGTYGFGGQKNGSR